LGTRTKGGAETLLRLRSDRRPKYPRQSSSLPLPCLWNRLLTSETFIQLLHKYPYHADSLLQLYEALKITGDLDAAEDLLERLLYRFETAWHSRFDPRTSQIQNAARLIVTSNFISPHSDAGQQQTPIQIL
jgi:hypothetical protein